MNRLIAILKLIAFYAWEVVKSNLTVARDVLGSPARIRPGLVTVRTEELTDLQAFTLANLVTMTPGTLSIEISPAKRELLIHTLYAQNPEKLQMQIAQQLERRVRDAI